MRKIIGIGVLAVFVVMALIFIGCDWFGSQKQGKYTGPLKKVTLGVESSLLPAAVWVAENKGYFREQGLDLTIKEFDSGRLSLLAMLNGEVDISTAAPTPIMFSSFDRQDFSVFATFAYAYEDIKVTARKDKGISTATDLKSKKIGTPAGTTGQFFTETFLIHNGIPATDVEVINIAPSDLPEALNNGDVDAIVIWEPVGSNARELLGDNAIILPSTDVYKTTFNFLAMNDFTRDNPEALKRFLRAIDKATTFIENNKVESQDIAAKRLNLDKEEMIVHWDVFTFEISLDQSLLIGIEDEARWAIRSSLTDKTGIPNYLDYIYMDALKAVKPDAVNIIY